MEIDPLKIPAFMRKKSLKRNELSDFFRISKESPSPVSSEPDRPQYRFTPPISIPTLSIPVTPRPVKIKREPVLTPVGMVTHYLDKINVVIVKLGVDVRVGDRLVFNGEKGPFRQKLKSMQIDRQNVETAGYGKEVGIKVNKKAVVGEMVYVMS